MIKNNKKLTYWLAIFIWLEIIFLLSSIPSSLLPKMPLESLEFWAHRCAHIGEYTILGILLFRAYAYKKARVGIYTILFLSMFILLAGLFDEWHQSFVPGRTCQLLDAIFDTICGTGGMLIYFVRFKKIASLRSQ